MAKIKLFKRRSLLDLAYEINLKGALKKLDKGFNYEHARISTILQMWELKKFYDDKKYLTELYADMLNKRESKFSQMLSFLSKRFHNINDCEFIKDVKSIKKNKLSLTTYFEIICFYKTYENINVRTIKRFISLLPLHTVISNKKFVSKFETIIIDKLIKDPSSCALLIEKYDLNDDKDIFIPNLDVIQVDKIIKNYMNSIYPDVDYLRMLSYHKNAKGTYSILRKTRVLIEKAIEDNLNKIFAKGTSISFNTQIGFDSTISEPLKMIHKDTDWTIKINDKQFFVDLSNIGIVRKMRGFCGIELDDSISGLYNLLTDRSIFELARPDYKFIYGNDNFNHNDGNTNMIFAFCVDAFQAKGIKVEEKLEWFINDYFKDKYGIEGFDLKLKCDATYQIECEHLFNQMESLLKEFRILVEEGKLEPILIKCTLDSLPIDQCPSMYKRKYAELNRGNAEIMSILNLIFGSQSSLNYINEEINEISFSDLILKHDVRLNDFPKYAFDSLQFLANLNIIDIKNVIVFKSGDVYFILKQLYENLYVNYAYAVRKYKIILTKMEKRGWVKFNNHLLSTPESNYFSYYLNNQKYINSLMLRNEYEHGNTNYLTEEINKINYLKALRLFCILLFKIDNELRNQ